MPPKQFLGKVNAPDFPSDIDWLNTDRPLSLEEFRGKLVLLDFWTYCCINCMHILPELRKLEHKYADELAVIGVHSAKFRAERATQNIREAIMRYDIEHPVINDAKFVVWQSYAVRAWPTLMFVDPVGKVLARHEGEFSFDDFDQLVGELLQKYEEEGLLDHRPLRFKLEKEKELERPLSYPAKVLADPDNDRVFIADSNHHRLVIASLDGAVREVIGGMEAGMVDGGFENARFSDPKGMALVGESLYVADTGNHTIRRIDLPSRTVETIAGTGRQARRLHSGGEARSCDLSSPWDIFHHNGFLYVAMAGSHQLWRLDLEGGTIRPHAGSGREGISDDSMDAAMLAQPCGIATDGQVLYFADSETSSVRAAPLSAVGSVVTIVGLDLFKFGDVDGVGEDVLLQHVQGLAVHGGRVYIADTYNNKIKVIDPEARECRTLIGSGENGSTDGPLGEAQFNEPGGLSVTDTAIYIADTNNHVIRVADRKSGQVRTLDLKFPQ